MKKPPKRLRELRNPQPFRWLALSSVQKRDVNTVVMLNAVKHDDRVYIPFLVASYRSGVASFTK